MALFVGFDLDSKPQTVDVGAIARHNAITDPECTTVRFIAKFGSFEALLLHIKQIQLPLVVIVVASL